MKEIGGYIELEHYNRSRLHEGAIALNCGRNALAYLCRLHNLRKVWIPFFLCDCVSELLKREAVTFDFYHIDNQFLPCSNIKLKRGEAFYLVNFYGQIGNNLIEQFSEQYERLIVDNAQDYFREPVEGVDTLYTCRKFFGVADGAFLYTDADCSAEQFTRDVSFDRMRFLLGRFEKSASEFYPEYVRNNALFSEEPVKAMSRLTDNLLRSIDYESVRKRRNANWKYLESRLSAVNGLRLQCDSTDAPFAYPLFISHGKELRRALIEHKIYIPTLWPNVFSLCPEDSLEYRLAADILPLPVDQRYTQEDMERMCDVLFSLLR